MKKNYFYAFLLVFAVFTLNAQTIEIDDDFESYAAGSPISGAHWTDWGCGGGAGCAIMCSVDQAHSGAQSGNIPSDGSTDAVLDLGNKIFGTWGLSFWMYVPSNQEAYFNFQGVVPIGAGEWIVGNIFFNEALGNPGQGYIDWSTSDTADDTYFSFPHDQWFQVITNVDISTGISTATWQFYVDGVEVIAAGTPFADGAGTYPTSYGGIDFFSISTDNNYYLDDVLYQDEFLAPDVSVQDLENKGFSAYPNPVTDQLNLRANEMINSVSISNILGQEVYRAEINSLHNSIDFSEFKNGTYFVSVKIGDTEGTVKVLK